MSNNHGSHGNQIVIQEPDDCMACGWVKPPEAPQQTSDPEPDLENMWLVLQIPKSVIWLHICPKCGTARANKNAVENVRRLNELKDQRIIYANSPLVVPH